MKKTLLTIAAALGVAAMAFHALAQAPGPRHGGDPIAMIAALHDQLSLNTSQQQQWDGVIAQAQAAKQAIVASVGQLKAAMQAELAKAEPDLAALAAQADAIHQQNAAVRKSVRDSWLALYATFSTDQKAVVRDAIVARLAKMQQWRANRQSPTPTLSQ